ncbi:hypothetical protein HDU76_013040 [Blyttiomyces sp. JEL0837]|nr:hypothetical protein HDU76_013040 [Blyttiomyces sp. JEL0837]
MDASPAAISIPIMATTTTTTSASSPASTPSSTNVSSPSLARKLLQVKPSTLCIPNHLGMSPSPTPVSPHLEHLFNRLGTQGADTLLTPTTLGAVVKEGTKEIVVPSKLVGTGFGGFAVNGQGGVQINPANANGAHSSIPVPVPGGLPQSLPTTTVVFDESMAQQQQQIAKSLPSTSSSLRNSTTAYGSPNLAPTIMPLPPAPLETGVMDVARVSITASSSVSTSAATSTTTAAPPPQVLSLPNTLPRTKQRKVSSHVTLANTAVGLREIAKKLGKAVLQWESPPKTVLIVTKIHDPDLVRITRDMSLWLMSFGLTVLVEDRLKDDALFGWKEEQPIPTTSQSSLTELNMNTMLMTLTESDLEMNQASFDVESEEDDEIPGVCELEPELTRNSTPMSTYSATSSSSPSSVSNVNINGCAGAANTTGNVILSTPINIPHQGPSDSTSATRSSSLSTIPGPPGFHGHGRARHDSNTSSNDSIIGNPDFTSPTSYTPTHQNTLTSAIPSSRHGQSSSQQPQQAQQAQQQQGQMLFWNAEYCEKEAPNQVDLIVTLGGDGTVLFTASLFSKTRVPPIVPFDLGSLGFLAVFDFEKAKATLSRILGIGKGVSQIQQVGGYHGPGHHYGHGGVVVSSPTPTGNVNGLSRNGSESEVDNNVLVGSIPSTTTTTMDENMLLSIPRPLSDSNLQSQSQTHSQVPTFDNVNLHFNNGSMIGKHSGFPVNMRMRLACTVWRRDESTGDMIRGDTHQVLNELVVDRGPSPYMSQLELFVDDGHLTTMQADGLVVATPTGSTAYSLSANGSMVHPAVPTILVTPICPHTLSFRPMLLPDSIELKVLLPLGSRTATAWAAFDGRNRTELRQGDFVSVSMSRYPVPTVCNDDQSKDWFESLRRCLHWNVRMRQKEFK